MSPVARPGPRTGPGLADASRRRGRGAPGAGRAARRGRGDWHAWWAGAHEGRPSREGPAWYVSTLPEPDALRELLFLLNHGREPVTVEVPGSHREPLGGGTVTGSLTLDRYGVAVLRS